MSLHPYTEDQLVEQPAIQLFNEMGWEHVVADEEIFGVNGTLGRETKSEAVLVRRLRVALMKLNASLNDDAFALAIDELSKDRSAMSPAEANRQMWEMLREGVKVSVIDHKHGGQSIEKVRVIDWENILANDFLIVNQMTITGALYTRRPDLIGFVNGLPLVLIEFKKPGVPAREAFDDNIRTYKSDIPQVMWSNALLIATNGTDSRVGSLTADWERFFEWKRIESEDEPRRVSLEVMLRGTCDPARLLDIVENFTIFSEHKSGLVKIIGQNHQFIGVNNAITAMMSARAAGHGRGGVFWQTQGSGKSFAMVFFAQKILRKISGNWTFVVVTDRTDLDTQIAKTFKSCGAVTEAEGDECHAESGAHLRTLLSENHRYVFTLIQKFQSNEVLCDRRDVVVLTDEAHRSQYDTLAVNMRSALPNALFLAFTGTPLIAGEERTKEVFGDYVSIYDFQQSVEDGATVPLYYENRTPELHLVNPDLNDHIYDLIENADLNPSQEERLEKELGRQYHLITRDERLETVANDIVTHFLGRGFIGKAMVISIDKATALRMYNKVHDHWEEEKVRVKAELRQLSGASSATDQITALQARLTVLEQTKMALIVSSEQNEILKMKERGLDIVPHRKLMNDGALDDRFKDPTDPLRIAFVCAMWMTGFDAPSCSTVYLDKPMRNHTLMQTIARANRVFLGKHSGLIVDYANVFTSLEKALAIYGKGTGGATPVSDKQKLVDDLRSAISAAISYCKKQGVDIVHIDSLDAASVDRLSLLAEAVNSLISPDSIRKEFLASERLVDVLYTAVKPDPVVVQFATTVYCLGTIASAIRERTEDGPPDITGVMSGINRLLDESIAAEGFVIREGKKSGKINLSNIDFEALAKRFKQSKQKNIDIETLKAAIRARLERLIQLNKNRADYLEKFEELIESYNAGSRNIDELFKELVALSNALTEEEQRHVRENLSEAELTIFDILTRPGPELSAAERNDVKKVAHELLEKLNTLLVLNWRQKVQACARVRNTIDETLDGGLPRVYTKPLYEVKSAAVFEHVYESYFGEGESVYGRAG